MPDTAGRRVVLPVLFDEDEAFVAEPVSGVAEDRVSPLQAGKQESAHTSAAPGARRRRRFALNVSILFPE